MIVARVVSGVYDHFRLRLPEWVKSVGMTLMGLNFLRPADTFAMSPGYVVISQIASETTWGIVLTAIGLSRFLALLLNGNFAWFKRWSPLVRCICSGFSCSIWLMLGVGNYLVDSHFQGWIVFGMLTIVDGFNGIAIAGEAGTAFRAYRNERAASGH